MKDRYNVSFMAIIYRICFVVILTVIMFGFLYVLFQFHITSRDYLLMALILIWIIALIRYWIYIVTMPYRIICLDGDRIRIESLLSRHEIPCKDIHSLRISPIYSNFLKIITSKKKITMLSHIDGLHELIHYIKAQNPELKTRGC